MARSKSGKLGVGSQGPLLDPVDFLKGLVGQVLQQVLETEFTAFLGGRPYENSASHQGHRNGSYPMRNARIGKVPYGLKQAFPQINAKSSQGTWREDRITLIQSALRPHCVLRMRYPTKAPEARG